MVKLSKYEQETIITFNEEEDIATCFTYNRKLQRKLGDLSQKSSTVALVSETNGAETYTFPKTWVKVQKPRQLSEEMKQVMSQRAKENFGHE